MYAIAMYFLLWGAIIASLFNKKLRKQVHGQAKTMFKLHKHIKKDDRVVWMHVASLGEFEMGRLLLAFIRKFHPEYKILLSFFSPSGYEVMKDFAGADVVVYLPFDTPGNAASFIRLAHPEIMLLVKYEFWANYIYIAKHSGTRVYSVSSTFRPDHYFFKWYGNVGPLRRFDHFLVQNDESVEVLKSHGFQNVTKVGDTRFDRVIMIKAMSPNIPMVKTFVDGKKCFIAGSSWGGDEEIYIPYFNQHKDWKMIIAPHKITGAHINSIKEKLGDRKVVCFSQFEDNEFNQKFGNLEDSERLLKEADVLIVDCFGKLSSIYRYGDIALIGGGFLISGIHNVPEAAVYGIPVVFGPRHQKFPEAQAIIDAGGAIEFHDADSFNTIMDDLVNNPEKARQVGKKAKDFIYSNAGAVQKCYEAIFQDRPVDFSSITD